MKNSHGYHRRYYQAHRERLLARANAYYRANREDRLEYQREWRERNKHARKVAQHLGTGVPEARRMLGANP